jgi:hypothetical protein
MTQTKLRIDAYESPQNNLLLKNILKSEVSHLPETLRMGVLPCYDSEARKREVVWATIKNGIKQKSGNFLKPFAWG